MNTDKISLNFLELTPKKFEVTYYRKKLELIPLEERKAYFINNFMENIHDEKTTKYAIVFNELEGFEKIVISQNENINITKRFIFNALEKHLDSTGIVPLETNRDKYHRIYLPLKTHNEGIETVWIEPYFLRHSNSYGYLLDYKFCVNDEYKRGLIASVDKKILQLSGTLDNKGYANKAFYQFKFEKIKQFFIKYYSKIDQIKITDNDYFTLASTLIELNCYSLNPKIYQFQNDVENSSPYFGLQKNIPYQFPDKPTNFLFVFRDIDRDIAIKLLNGLKGQSSPNTFSGIEKLFRIPFNNDCIRGKKVSELNIDVFDEIIREVELGKKNNINLLPIILTNSKNNEGDDKLYYLMKHTFTKKNIPCQVVTKDLILNTNTFNWSISNIGLQIFAKSGGKPWKVKPAIKKGLIIGIGSKNKEVWIVDENNQRKKKTEKYLTYSVLTDSSGLFKEIQILSETDNEADYYEALVFKLNLLIQQAIKDGNKDIVIHR